MAIVKIFESYDEIVESDGTGKSADKSFEKPGYGKLEEEFRKQNFNLKLINLSREKTVPIKLNELYFKQLYLPKIFLQPKFFISVSKAKLHYLTCITGILKNQFGCLPEKDKIRFHHHIDEVIVDVNSIIKPDLSIVNGRVWMEDIVDGPIKWLGVLICGRDPVSVDATLARLVGFNPKKSRHIHLAEQHGIGSMNPVIIREKLEKLKTSSRKPNRAKAAFQRYAPKIIQRIAVNFYREIKR